jgi:hypothetical protein
MGLRAVGGVDEEVHQALAFGSGGAVPEELGGGFDRADFLGDCGGDPLVEGDSVLPGEALGGLLDRVGKLERVGCFGHLHTMGKYTGHLGLRAEWRALRLRPGAVRWESRDHVGVHQIGKKVDKFVDVCHSGMVS